jgi:hypothetical protein
VPQSVFEIDFAISEVSTTRTVADQYGSPVFRLHSRDEYHLWHNIMPGLQRTETFSLFGFAGYGSITTALNSRLAFPDFAELANTTDSVKLKVYCSVIHRLKCFARFWQLATRKFRSSKDVHMTGAVIEEILTYLCNRFAVVIAHDEGEEVDENEMMRLLTELSKTRYELSFILQRDAFSDAASLKRFFERMTAHVFTNLNMVLGIHTAEDINNSTNVRHASKFLPVSTWLAALPYYLSQCRYAAFGGVPGNSKPTLRAIHQLCCLQNIIGITSRAISGVVCNRVFFSHVWQAVASVEYASYSELWSKEWIMQCKSEAEKKQAEALFKLLNWRLMPKSAKLTVCNKSGGVIGFASEDPRIPLQQVIRGVLIYFEKRRSIGN